MSRQQENAQIAKEKIGELRGQFSSMVLRGRYKDCFKLIEENIKLLYFGERWPENFIGLLRIHKQCFLSMDIMEPYEEYLAALLRKQGIPAVFAKFIKKADRSVDWSVENLKSLSIIAKTQKEFEDALDYCALISKVDPNNSSCFILKGKILEDMGQTAQATEAYKEALLVNEKNYQAWMSLAENYEKTDLKLGLEAIEKAIEMAPSEPEFHEVKAELLGRSGNYVDAVDAINKSIALDPLGAKYLYRKGELLLAQDQTLAALRQFTQAIAIDEKHLQSHWRLAKLHTLSGQYDRAITHADVVVSIELENIEALLLRAFLSGKMGDTQSATNQYMRILEIDSACAKAHAGLGGVYIQENPERALGYYESAIKLDEKNVQYHLGKAQALENMGNQSAATTEYKTVLELDNKIAKAYGALGRFCLKTDPKESVRLFAKAIELEPKNPYYYHGKSLALMEQGESNISDAVAILMKAVECDPGNSELRLQLAQLLEKIGNFASSAEHYRFAASLDPLCMPAHHGLARVLSEYEPHLALESINLAIVIAGANQELFYWKGIIFDFLAARPESIAYIKQRVAKGEVTGDDLKELKEIINGNAHKLALVSVDHAIALTPGGDSRYFCARARLLHNMGNSAKALVEYDKVLKLDPQNHEALFGVGRIQASKKDTKILAAALVTLDKAISLAPDIPSYRVEKARLLARKHQTRRQALEEYESAISLGKEQWWVVLEKAMLLDEMGDLLEASKYYRRTLLGNPDCLEATARMGLLLEDKNNNAAINYLNRAIELDPDNPRYHMWRMRLYYGIKDTQKAQEECEKVLALAGDSHETRFNLAQHIWQREPDVALEHLGYALEKSPDKQEYILLRGDIFLRAGDKAGAAESFNKVLELNEKSHEAMAKLSDILFQSNDPRCLELIDQALEIDEDNPAYLYAKAKAMDELGQNISGAKEAVAAIMKIDPDNLIYREKYVELLGKNKNRIRAFMEKGKLEKLRRAKQKAQEAEEAAREAQDKESAPATEPETK